MLLYIETKNIEENKFIAKNDPKIVFEVAFKIAVKNLYKHSILS